MTGSIGNYSNVSGIDGQKIADDIKTPGGLFAGKARKKVRAAKAEVIEAGNKTNKDVKNTNDKGSTGFAQGVDSNDTATYELDEGIDNKEESQDTGATAEVQESEANTDAASIQQIGETALANTVAIQEMQTNCEAGKEEIMAQIQESLDGMNDAGAQLAANMIEAESLGAELEGLTGDESGADGFSTSMAAAGGANNAYGLNIPTGDNGAKANGANKGGLISSGTQGTQQGGFAPSTPAGENSSTTDRTRAIYARLAEIETQNLELQETIIKYSEYAKETQIQYAESTDVVSSTAEASNTTATQGQADAKASGEAFAKITEYGNYTKLAGTATIAVGTGMIVAGSTTEVAGTGIKSAGTLMKGIGAGLRSLGAALLPGVFTAPAGSAVTGASIGVNSAGQTTIAVGNTVTTVGKGLGKAGVTTQTVGKGVKAAGEATVAVGSAGTTVTNIANRNWLGALASGLSCLGSAASCISDTAQFAALVDQGKGEFLSSVQQFSNKMNNWMSKAMGKGDVATKQTVASGNFVTTGSVATGNLHVAQEVIDTTVLTGNVATQGFTMASNAVSQYMEDNNINQDTGASAGTTTAQPEEKSQTYQNAVYYGLNSSTLEGKSDAEINKLIADFNTGKINADGTPKKEKAE